MGLTSPQGDLNSVFYAFALWLSSGLIHTFLLACQGCLYVKVGYEAYIILPGIQLALHKWCMSWEWSTKPSLSL